MAVHFSSLQRIEHVDLLCNNMNMFSQVNRYERKIKLVSIPLHTFNPCIGINFRQYLFFFTYFSLPCSFHFRDDIAYCIVAGVNALEIFNLMQFHLQWLLWKISDLLFRTYDEYCASHYKLAGHTVAFIKALLYNLLPHNAKASLPVAMAQQMDDYVPWTAVRHYIN